MYIVQPDQMNMALLFWYIVKSDAPDKSRFTWYQKHTTMNNWSPCMSWIDEVTSVPGVVPDECHAEVEEDDTVAGRAQHLDEVAEQIVPVREHGAEPSSGRKKNCDAKSSKTK